ncbi:MAG: response regulator [Deltaproteobacteria bacterium]|nr:response regulator [Deltaproteobacteria bacterium]
MKQKRVGKVHVLIVDDEEIVCKRLYSSLTKHGYEVETFTDPQKAMDHFAENRKFDIVVTDIRMEGLDGLDILNAVRVLKPGTKTIMITGYATMEVAREAQTKGAFDLIAKPFKPKDLLKLLDKAVRELNQEGG